MKFDKSKVYTSLNAEELEAGDVVYVADSIEELKKLNPTMVRTLGRILSESHSHRFENFDHTCSWSLAYLIAKHYDPYKEFKQAQAEGKEVWYHTRRGKWKSNKVMEREQDFLMPTNCYSLTKPKGKEFELGDKEFKLGDKVVYYGILQLITAIDLRSISHTHIYLSFSGWLKDDELERLKKLKE